MTLIESIGLSGRSLKPWVIFKGKQHMKAWWDIFTTGHISVSENGWTDNDICFKWLKRCFEPKTRPTTPEKWRLLLFDGHVSHLMGRAIDFCLEHKIVCFCLPAIRGHHTTTYDVQRLYNDRTTAYYHDVMRGWQHCAFPCNARIRWRNVMM